MKRFFIKFVLYYLPAFIWAGLIYYFSSIPNLRYEARGNLPVEIIIRKGAHFIEYIILAFLVWRIFYAVHKLKLSASLVFAFFVSSIYAASDEFHQSFVIGRSGRLADFFYDIISALIILQSIWLINKFTKQKAFVLFMAIMILLGLEWYMIEDGKLYEESLIITNSQKETLKNNYLEEKKIDEVPKIENQNQAVEQNIKSEKTSENKKKYPPKIKIEVPFTTQAPFSNWDEFHEEACEEASLIMLKYYLDGKKLDKDTAEKEIQDLIKYQMKKYGDYRDSDAEQVVEIARDYYRIKNLKVVYDFEMDDVKYYLSKGKPIIVPAAGRLLGNPNFKSPGPLYHNLVLVGYDGDTIVTNDPGTRNGQNYEYNLKTLYNSLHDFPGDLKNIEKGRKAMIIIE